MLMLREWSTSTVTTFCCGRKVAMLRAGCQRRRRRSATMAVSKSQITTGRAPLSRPCRLRTWKKSATPAAIARNARIQIGQGVRKTSRPLENAEGEYLKRNSNIWLEDRDLAFSFPPLMSHGVNDVVDAGSVCLGSILHFVLRIVGMLEGIAVILIEGHGYHDAVIVVVDSSPM